MRPRHMTPPPVQSPPISVGRAHDLPDSTPGLINDFHTPASSAAAPRSTTVRVTTVPISPPHLAMSHLTTSTSSPRYLAHVTT
eukprot:CAMPEP_0182533366 /NCGR_PEP_ID=MMETSP1323-20130603/13642_1 /TAXON_ID=236787 /ORGANISM="Florenciella parvula, Strain RCC1693" /LENGTH=82 /DNA_ID=CAMNT_0024743237 /DNA_START=514 /DNA_END=762 /DNA_ORIENTATION=+